MDAHTTVFGKTRRGVTLGLAVAVAPLVASIAVAGGTAALMPDERDDTLSHSAESEAPLPPQRSASSLEDSQ